MLLSIILLVISNWVEILVLHPEVHSRCDPAYQGDAAARPLLGMGLKGAELGRSGRTF